MEFKKLNQFEISGLETILNEYLPLDGTSYDYEVCGICNNNLINMEIMPALDVLFPGHPLIGSFGLNSVNDIVIEFWSEDLEDNIYRCISLFNLIKEEYDLFYSPS